MSDLSDVPTPLPEGGVYTLGPDVFYVDQTGAWFAHPDGRMKGVSGDNFRNVVRSYLASMMPTPTDLGMES